MLGKLFDTDCVPERVNYKKKNRHNKNHAKYNSNARMQRVKQPLQIDIHTGSIIQWRLFDNEGFLAIMGQVFWKQNFVKSVYYLSVLFFVHLKLHSL